MSEQNSVDRPTTPATIILSDNKERVLRYSLGAMKALKLKFGQSLFKGGLNDLDEDKLPILIWYGLKHEDPNLTVEQVEDLIDAQMLPYVMDRFMKAFGGSTKNAPAPPAEILPSTAVN